MPISHCWLYARPLCGLPETLQVFNETSQRFRMQNTAAVLASAPHHQWKEEDSKDQLGDVCVCVGGEIKGSKVAKKIRNRDGR